MATLSGTTSPPVHKRTEFVRWCDRFAASGTAAARKIERWGTEIMSNRSSDASCGVLGRGGDADAPDPVVALVVRARRGEQEAWDRLVHRYTPLLWFVARSYRLANQDAADVVQTTWLRCVEQLDRIREPARLAGWLVTVCQRECLLTQRLAARCRPADPAGPLGPLADLPDRQDTGDPAGTAVARDEALAVHEAISRLPERQRLLLTALLDGGDQLGHGYAEVAAALGVPIGSIGPTRQRALQRLRHDPRLQELHHPK